MMTLLPGTQEKAACMNWDHLRLKPLSSASESPLSKSNIRLYQSESEIFQNGELCISWSSWIRGPLYKLNSLSVSEDILPSCHDPGTLFIGKKRYNISLPCHVIGMPAFHYLQYKISYCWNKTISAWELPKKMSKMARTCSVPSLAKIIENLWSFPAGS